MLSKALDQHSSTLLAPGTSFMRHKFPEGWEDVSDGEQLQTRRSPCSEAWLLTGHGPVPGLGTLALNVSNFTILVFSKVNTQINLNIH